MNFCNIHEYKIVFTEFFKMFQIILNVPIACMNMSEGTPLMAIQRSMHGLGFAYTEEDTNATRPQES